MLREFNCIVKLRHEAGEPADIDPLKVTLKPDAVPIWFKQRRYPQNKREVMALYVKELLKLGSVRKDKAPEWASAPVVVP